MKGILRSVIDFGGTSQAELVGNLQKLIPANLSWLEAEEKVFNYVVGYFRQHLTEVPAKQTLLDYFVELGDHEVIETIKDIESATPYIRTNFKHLVDKALDEQNKIAAIGLLKQSQEIMSKGLIIDMGRGQEKKKLQGLKDGILHFTQNAPKFLISNSDARIRGNLRDDGEEVKQEYQMAKANKALAWGKFCGLNNIDSIVKGIKKGELWLHAAYTGELKTTFALNWAYNLVTKYRRNVFYTSLEMPYEQLRQQIYVMHSSNADFVAYAKSKGIDPALIKPLDYDKVKNGDLTPDEEAFYDFVANDFSKNPLYGAFHVWSPDHDVTIDDIRTEAETYNEENEIDLLVIDHGGLVEPRKREKSSDYTIRLNSVLRDAKKLALHFKNGSKIPVLLLFQINREGKDYADKMEGRYKLRALSYANEAERSADMVTTTYLNDEHRKAGTTLFDCLKRRDGAFFEPFIAKIDWKTKRISNADPFQGSSDKGLSIDDHRSICEDMSTMFA